MTQTNGSLGGTTPLFQIEDLHVEVEGRESALFTLRDGKVVRYEWFHEPDDAYAAATQ